MTQPSAQTLLRMYEIAATAKECDEKLRALLMQGRVMVLYHPPRGQEIVAAGYGVSLRSDDYVVNIYRGLHDHIAKGVPLRDLLCEILGKAPGACRGRGGAMHVTDPDAGVMLTTGVVGSGLPVANGLALASMLRGDGRVTVCNFGDGAANIGAFHEALNMASLWKLPVVFVCQNNQYGEHTPLAKHLSCEHIADRAVAYGMVGITVDGNDPVAMYGAARTAIERARAGEGPTLLEAVTFRLAGHYAFDDCSYMPEGLLASAKAADPVLRFRAQLVADGTATEGDVGAIDTRVRAAVEDAAEFALAADYPDPARGLDYVYAEEVAV